MTEALLEIRGLARDFAAAELRPHTEAWDAAAAMGDDIASKLAELGFFGMLVPESAGGMAFDLATYAAALEELAWGEPSVALLLAQSTIAADLIARFGGAANAQRLESLASGESIGCIAFAEDHDAASDAQAGAGAADALSTRAERDGDGWRITGRKRWVTNGDRADIAIVLARAERGDALFVVARDDGFATGARATTMGMRPVGIVDLEFDGVRIDDGRRLDAGAEPRAAADTLAHISGAAIATGIAQAALDHAVAYAAQREQFGQPIRNFEGIRNKLADMATRTAAARALLERAAMTGDGATAAMAKLAAGSCAMSVTTEAVQVFGGYGYMRDYPVEKLMRDARAMEIVHGTSDLLRLRIAASLYS